MTVRMAQAADAPALAAVQAAFAAAADAWFPGGVYPGDLAWAQRMLTHQRVYLSEDAIGSLGALMIFAEPRIVVDKGLMGEQGLSLAVIPPAVLWAQRGGTLIQATALWIATVKELFVAWFTDAAARGVPWCWGETADVPQNNAFVRLLGVKAGLTQDSAMAFQGAPDRASSGTYVPRPGWVRWIVDPASAAAKMAGV